MRSGTRSTSARGWTTVGATSTRPHGWGDSATGRAGGAGRGATVLLIVLIVGIALRAVLAPIVTVLSAGVAFLISQFVLGWVMAHSKHDKPSELRESPSR